MPAARRHTASSPRELQRYSARESSCSTSCRTRGASDISSTSWRAPLAIAMLVAFSSLGGGRLSVYGATLPTTLPVSDTTSISYAVQGYTGSIPTELGDLVEVTSLDLKSNRLSGPTPTELGKLVKMASNFLLYSNQLTSTLPTELGRLVNFNSKFELYENLLCGAVPSEMSAMGEFGPPTSTRDRASSPSPLRPTC